MQKVLSLLLAFVFLQAETYALSGGPVFGSSGTTALNVVGTYAGVLTPESLTGETGEDTDDGDVVGTTASTSLGLFTVGVGETGPAVGAAIIFVAGAAFNGNITGIVDPQDGSFDAVIDGVSNFVISRFIQTGTDDNGNAEFTEVTSRIFAQGSVTAEIIALSNGNFGGVSNTRLEGTASIDVFGRIDPDDGSPIVSSTTRYTVEGFKQSDTVAVVPLALTGNNTGL